MEVAFRGSENANLRVLFKCHHSSVAACICRWSALRGRPAEFDPFEVLVIPASLLHSLRFPGGCVGKMRIVADENMPLVKELFSAFGEVVRLPGRQISAVDLRGADVLLVRSVTRVTAELLAQSRVRFVGTATIGTDHIDRDDLAALGVQVAAAPGCNARAVAEYVLTCLLILAREQGWSPEQRHVGVVGLGNVGRQVASLLRAAGFRVSGCDPFRSDSGVPEVCLTDVDALLESCDIICLHTPLTRDGAHPTWHLLGADRLSRMTAAQVLLNAGRGDVIDNRALLQRLREPEAPAVILDVWEGEPLVLPALLDRVRLGTPHVAGYSREGKWRGTAMVHEALCRFLGVVPDVTPDTLALPGGPVVACPPAASLTDLVGVLARGLCKVERDDAALRASLGEVDPAQAFDRLRRDYPVRCEFASSILTGTVPPDWRPGLRALGFSLAPD